MLGRAVSKKLRNSGVECYDTYKTKKICFHFTERFLNNLKYLPSWTLENTPVPCVVPWENVKPNLNNGLLASMSRLMIGLPSGNTVSARSTTPCNNVV